MKIHSALRVNQARFVWELVVWIFLALGLLGWFGGYLARFDLPFWHASAELPLGGLKGIVVDDEGRIFWGLQFYERVQVYDSSGQFLNGWFVDARGGAYRMRLNSAGLLEMATARNDMLLTFDMAGNLVARELSGQYYENFGAANEYHYRDDLGNTYTVRNRLYYPK